MTEKRTKTRRARRYVLWGTALNVAIIRHSDGRVCHYWAPAGGGYVYDVSRSPGTSGRQVTRGMGSLGDTLRWSGHGWLSDLLRPEIRAYYKAEDRWDGNA